MYSGQQKRLLNVKFKVCHFNKQDISRGLEEFV